MYQTQFRWVCCVLIGGLIAAHDAQAQDKNNLIPLKASLKSVLNSHTRVAAAREEVSAAKYRAIGLGKPMYNPEIGADTESAEVNTYAISLNQSISTGGKRTARKMLGESGQALAWAEFEQLRHEIVIDIIRAMVEYKSALASMDLANRRSELMEEFYNTAKKRHEFGDLSQSELNLARVAFATALDQANASQRAESIAKSALLVISQGTSVGIWPEIQITTTALPLPSDEKLLGVPSIQLAMLQAEVASANAGLAKANTKPDPNFSLKAGREGEDTLLGLSFSIPIFIRNNFSDEQRASLNEETAALIRAQAQISETRIRLEVLGQSYDAASEGWQSWQQLMAGETQPALDLIELLWKSGDITTSEYLLQLNQLIESSAAGINLRFRTQEIWVDWLEATASWRDWFTKGELS